MTLATLTCASEPSFDGARPTTKSQAAEAAEPLAAPRARERRLSSRRGEAGRAARRDPAAGAPSSSPRASSRTSARRTRARRTTRSRSSPSRDAGSTPGRCECSRRRRTAGSRRQLGAEQVGLVTGEERINDGAPIICCTVEMAPSSGDVLVLDEVQWADDEERGSAWTRLLLAGEYRHIRVLGALDALPLVEHAFPQAELRVFERKLPLEWVGERMLRSVTPGTVVVAFSRKAVLALAGEVHRLRPGRVAVLYGAMPLASRREEIDRFLDGERRRLRRHRRPRSRREPALRDAALRRDDEVRRPGAARPRAVGAGPDRRPGRPLRARRAGARRCARRRSVGERGSRSRAWRRSSLTSSCRTGTAATASSTRRASGRACRISTSTTLAISTPRSPPGTASPCGNGPTRAGWRWSRSSRSAGGSAVVQRALTQRRRRLSLDDTWRLINAPIDEDGAEILGVFALAVAGDTSQRAAAAVAPRHVAAARRLARGCRGGRSRGRHPALVRAPVPRSRGRDDRARRRARGGRRRARRGTARRSRSATGGSAAAARADARARRGIALCDRCARGRR